MNVSWLPFELRPYPTPTLRPEGEYLQRAWTQSVYPLARRLGVDIRLPDISPQPYSNLAHQGLLFARDHGKANEYNHEVFAAFFQRGENIGDISVLTKIAASIGLVPDLFRTEMANGTYHAELSELLRAGVEEARVTAVPTFFIGTQRISGLMPAKDLAEIINEELAARTHT